MKLAMIVAIARNGVIGVDNQLPWHLPEDLKYFKRVTTGKPIIMGRKTFDSIGRPLPGRANIVITRNAEWGAEGVIAVTSLEQALQQGKRVAAAEDADEVMVIGGEQIYRMALPLADRLYLTRVDAFVEGDAFFPELDMSVWQEESSTEGVAAEGGPSYRFTVLTRKPLP